MLDQRQRAEDKLQPHQSCKPTLFVPGDPLPITHSPRPGCSCSCRIPVLSLPGTSLAFVGQALQLCGLRRLLCQGIRTQTHSFLLTPHLSPRPEGGGGQEKAESAGQVSCRTEPRTPTRQWRCRGQCPTCILPGNVQGMWALLPIQAPSRTSVQQDVGIASELLVGTLLLLLGDGQEGKQQPKAYGRDFGVIPAGNERSREQ